MGAPTKQIHNNNFVSTKYTEPLTLRELHRRAYRENSIEARPMRSFKTFEKLWRLIFLRLSRAMVVDTYEVRLPFRMGALYIKERGKTRQKLFKFGKDQQGRRMVTPNFLLDMHTNGRGFRFHWRKEGLTHKNTHHYKFTPAEGKVIHDDVGWGRRLLTHWVKKCHDDPYVQDYRAHV